MEIQQYDSSQSGSIGLSWTTSAFKHRCAVTLRLRSNAGCILGLHAIRRPLNLVMSGPDSGHCGGLLAALMLQL